MNTQSTQDRADEELRALLAQADPERGSPTQAPTHLLDRVLAETANPGDAAADAGTPSEPETAHAHGSDAPAPHQGAATDAPAGGRFLRRHWQGALVAAAAVASLALAAGTVLPGLTGGVDGVDDSVASIGAPAADGGVATEAEASADLAAREGGVAAGADPGDAAAAVPERVDVEQTLVRSGSLLVGTDDIRASRDAFVATVLALGGRITSESVVTEDSAGGGIEPYLADDAVASRDLGLGYPYPWPTGPGTWLSVQVPVAEYDEAMEAARATGEVIRMQQSSYDVGTQISDVDARIEALEASLARLTALMGQAQEIQDVIALEQAIAQRQSELDSLRARQRDLANQTAMSQISLALMSPEDARQNVDPTPEQTWWESFLAGLDQLWAWLGSALLIVSPLVLAMAIIWGVRRRQRRSGDSGTAAPAETGQAATAAETEAGPPTG